MNNFFRYTLLLLLMQFVLKADIIMGVVPQQGPLKLFKIWQPVIKYLSEQTGEKIRFRTEKNVDKFSKTLYAGKYDFVYMNPLQYVLVNKEHKYEALVRSNRSIKGVIIMKKGDSLKSLNKKKIRILFSSPVAFAATILVKYDLIQKYGFTTKQLDKARYVNSHDSVYKGLFRGVGDLGGGIERTFNFKDNLLLHKSLEIVHKTKAYPSHPFAIKEDISSDIKNKLTQALLHMPKELLERLHMKKLKKVKKNAYKSIEKLALKLNLKARG